MAANYTTLNEIIDSIEMLDNEAAYGHHLTKSKKRLLGMQGFRELNLDVARSIKGKKLEINAAGAVILPDDYMDYTGIFVVNDSNQLIPLSMNKLINISNEPILDHNYDPLLDHNYEMIYDSRDETTFTSSPTLTTGSERIYPNRSYNGFYGNDSFGNGYGYYRFDREDNTIQLAMVADIEYIYLEYISNGMESGRSDRIMVPIQVAEALEAFIMWKSVKYQRGIAAIEKAALRTDFYNEKKKARRRMNKFIPKELIDSTRKWTQQTVKR